MSSALYPNTVAPNATATPSVAKAQIIRYKKIVSWGLNPTTINFASAGTLGHRVCVSIPVDVMNQIFVWSRATGELAPTGRLNNPHSSNSSALADALVAAMSNGFNDLDGVATGLNFSTSALDMAGDLKRDPSVYNAGSLSTHYGANDLVMAYLMFKCFGASAYDPTAIIYNVDDAFNMLSSEQLAKAITDSLEAEDALANACVLPNGKGVASQVAGDNKGQVDAMFRAFLAADPLRYFLNGVQIPGLFETNFVALDASGADPSVGGNWCLTVGDKLEVPLQLVFRAPVNVLSVQDNVQNPSSSTPDSVNTNFIAGEAANFNAAVSKADKANIIPIRLQIVCGAPTGLTSGGTSQVALPLQVAASASAIFYTPANYGIQTAIAVAAAGGTGSYTYSFGQVLPANLPSVAQGLSINALTGLVTFKAPVATTSVAYDAAAAASTAADLAASNDSTNPVLAAAATRAKAAKVAAQVAMTNAGSVSGIAAVVSGKYAVPIVIRDSANPVATVTATVNMTFDNGAGSSNPANLPAVGAGSGGGDGAVAALPRPLDSDSAVGTWVVSGADASSVPYVQGTMYPLGSIVSIEYNTVMFYFKAATPAPTGGEGGSSDAGSGAGSGAVIKPAMSDSVGGSWMGLGDNYVGTSVSYVQGTSYPLNTVVFVTNAGLTEYYKGIILISMTEAGLTAENNVVTIENIIGGNTYHIYNNTVYDGSYTFKNNGNPNLSDGQLWTNNTAELEAPALANALRLVINT